MKLGFIGTGTIATAVVRGLAPEGHEIIVSERSRTNSAALAAEHENVTAAPNAQVVEAAEAICIALLPEHLDTALGGLPFREGQRILSFMADVPLERLQALCAPATVEGLVLPFPAIAHGRAPLLAWPRSELAEALFANHDLFTLQSAEEFKALLSAQAVLSPAATLVATAADWAAGQGADADTAEAFLRSLVAANLSASTLESLLAALDTPGGYNARLRDHMEEAGMPAALRAGLSGL